MQTLNNTITSQNAAKSKNPNIPAAILSGMMFLIPALGVPSELMLQDTLKSAIAAFGVLSCALVFFWQRRQQNTSLQFHGVVWLPILLMVYALGSMIWSHTYLAAVEAIRWFLFSLILWLSLNIFTKENISTLIWGIHGGAVVASTWAALQFWFDFSLFPQFAPPSSTFINANFFSEYLICTIPFSVWALITMRQSYWVGLISLSISLNIVAIMMTGTRSALFSLLIITPILILILVRYHQQLTFSAWSKTTKTITVLLIVAGIASMGSIQSSDDGKHPSAIQVSLLRSASIALPTEYTKGSVSIRAEMWKSTARMISTNTLFGVGAGSWEAQIPLYQPNNEVTEKDFYPHNEYLQLISEYGLPVGGLFLAILLAYLLKTSETTWKSKQEITLQEAPLRAFTLTSLLALFLISGVGFPWHLTSTNAIFAICLGLLVGSDSRLNIQERFFTANLVWHSKLSKLAFIFLIFATLLTGYIATQAARAEYKIVQAIQFGNSAKKLQAIGQQLSTERKAILISNMRDAIKINPHYRKISTIVAEQLAASGDWENAVWIWESAAASRPNVPGLWGSIAQAYTQLGQYTKALDAARTALRLNRYTPGMRALEINLLAKLEKNEQAIQLLTNYFDQSNYDYSLTQSGYLLGLKTKNFPLAIRALELRNKTWPKQAADGYFRLGNIYAEMQDDTKALESFRLGLRLVPSEEKDNFKNQVPERYRDQL